MCVVGLLFNRTDRHRTRTWEVRSLVSCQREPRESLKHVSEVLCSCYLLLSRENKRKKYDTKKCVLMRFLKTFE